MEKFISRAGGSGITFGRMQLRGADGGWQPCKMCIRDRDIAHHAAQPLESMMNLCKGANKHET